LSPFAERTATVRQNAGFRPESWFNDTVNMPEVAMSEPDDGPLFLHRLLIVTCSVLLVVLLLHLVRELATILQPLLIAVFLGYLILPAHAWLVRRGLPRLVATVVFLLLVVLILSILAGLVRRNVEKAMEELPKYQRRLEAMVDDALAHLPIERKEFDAMVRELPILTDAAEQLGRTLQAAETFLNFLTGMFLVFIYLAFLLAERANFSQRVRRALGEAGGGRVLEIIASINLAIAEYIAVKTFVSAVAGFASYVVLWLFGVDFAALWGILIFLFNFIPYLGSLVAVALPIALSFVQFGEPWKGLVIAVLLIGIQQAIGMFIEPKMAGQKLGVSPLLILLALAFWGLVWGIVGMILAVPLLVTTKIILDNIPETKPLATLMSNM
jgi:AI-2 transport protein TqsA